MGKSKGNSLVSEDTVVTTGAPLAVMFTLRTRYHNIIIFIVNFKVA